MDSQALRRKLDHARRLGATAFCFALFGTGAVLVWGILFPLFSVFLGRGAVRKRRARRLMSEVFRLFIAVMRGTGLLTYEVRHAERLEQAGCLLVSNHPSLIDVVLLISMLRNATCVVKPALLRNPFMRAPIKAMDYLCGEDPEILLERCAEELRAGSTLIVFPEGTRTRVAGTRPFQRGAANIALKAEAPILPVYIHCRPSWLTREHPWYYVPASPAHYRFEVGATIDPIDHGASSNRAIASRRLTRYLQDYFLEQERLHE